MAREAQQNCADKQLMSYSELKSDFRAATNFQVTALLTNERKAAKKRRIEYRAQTPAQYFSLSIVW